MTKKIRIVFGLILVLLVLINALQVYFLGKAYREAKDKFYVYCGSSLFGAVMRYHQLVDTPMAMQIPSVYVVTSYRDPVQIQRDSGVVRFHTSAGTPILDTLKRSIGREFVQYKTSGDLVDLHLMDSLYRWYLATKPIRSRFRMDTLVSRGVDRQPAYTASQLGLKQRPEYDITTNPYHLIGYSDILVFAQVKYDYNFLISELVWPLISCLLIFIFSNWALFFIYRTIKKQNRTQEIKNDFINNMTHELQTPVTIAMAGIDALLHQQPISDTERVRSYLQTSKAQLLQLKDLLEKILDISLRGDEQVSLKPERFNVNEVLRLIIHNHTLVAKKKIEFIFHETASVFIYADRTHFANALNNLVDNAIKYSGEAVTIALDVTPQNGNVYIRIRDNGIGISTVYQRQIFERFFRVPQGNTQKVKGFGLGLFYVKEIIAWHGGEILLHSAPGAGTEFIIRLPEMNVGI